MAALSSNSDWALLPVDVLHLILDYLVPMEDYLEFSKVCVQWQHAVCEKLQDLRSKHRSHCRLHQQVPLLINPTIERDRFCLYDAIQGKNVSQFELRLGQGIWRFEGSSHGWFFLFDHISFQVNLLNPFSEEIIRLPPLEDRSFYEFSVGDMLRHVPNKRRRCVLSMDPDDGNRDEIVVMMTCKPFERKIAFIKLGEEHWNYIEQLQDLEDIAYIYGFFCVVDRWGVPFSVHLNYNNNDEFYKVKRIHHSLPVLHRRDQYEYEFEQYLVESPEGDLLRVVRNKNKKESLFMIYKLIWLSENSRWEEVRNLGDVALFLGSNHSSSVMASDFPGCISNSIYFCHCSDYLEYASVYVFSVTEKTTKLLYSHSPEPLFWISSKHA